MNADRDYRQARILSHMNALAELFANDVRELTESLDIKPKPETNDIIQAAVWLEQGKKVRRRHWRESYIFLVADIGMIGFHERDGIEARLWHPMQIDLLAADWEVYKE